MTANEIVTQVKDLPVVSETARKLTIQLNQPDLHRDELVKTLRCDNVLTAKLLRACNSAEAAPREPILSVDQAIFLLGDNAIFRIVCAVGFGGSVGMTAPGYDTEANGLWNHSLATAMGVEFLADAGLSGSFTRSTAFTAGLLHDIGKTVLQRYLTPKLRADIRNKMTNESLSRVEAERAVLGADHCEIGACLLRRWSLQDCMVEAVANHHSPVAKPEVRLSALVYLANTAAHLAGNSPGWEARMAETNQKSADVLGLAVDTVAQLTNKIQEAMQPPPQLKAAA